MCSGTVDVLWHRVSVPGLTDNAAAVRAAGGIGSGSALLGDCYCARKFPW